MPTKQKIERRFFGLAEIRAGHEGEEGKIAGRAVVYGVESELIFGSVRSGGEVMT